MLLRTNKHYVDCIYCMENLFAMGQNYVYFMCVYVFIAKIYLSLTCIIPIFLIIRGMHSWIYFINVSQRND